MAPSRTIRGLFLAFAPLAVSACSKKSDDTSTSSAIAAATTSAPAVQAPAPASAAAPATPEPSFGSAAKAAGITGALTIATDPVKICPKTGLGKTSLKWEATGVDVIEIRVGAPEGGLLTQAGSKGTTDTGDWVRKGSIFYLQDGTKGVPRTLEHTIARAEVVSTVDGPCK